MVLNIPIIWLLLNLGVLYTESKNYSEAESNINLVLKTFKKLEPGHVIGQATVVNVYSEMGRWEAKNIIQFYKNFEAKFGSNHLNYVKSLFGLAVVMYDQEKCKRVIINKTN